MINRNLTLTIIIIAVCITIIVVMLSLAWGDWPAYDALYQSDVDYPLALGNTWTYSGEFYQGSNETDIEMATYTLTETVVDVLHSEVGNVMLYQIARTLEVQSCPEAWQQQPDSWCERAAIPEPDYVWYAVGKDTLYEMQTPEAHLYAENGIHQLVYPLAVGERWYLTQAMADANRKFQVDSMLRKVEAQDAVKVQAELFDACYHLSDIVGGNVTTLTYCPGVGFIERSSTHSGTPFGSFEELVSYEIEK